MVRNNMKLLVAVPYRSLLGTGCCDLFSLGYVYLRSRCVCVDFSSAKWEPILALLAS
jgi:hypothetical protein